MKVKKIQINYIKIIAVALFLFPVSSFASDSVGTIDAGFKLTKICQDVACTTFGNANWKPTINAMTPGATAVTITDSSITGHVWGDQIGWINLAPTGAGIFVNPTTGVITGKAFANSGSWVNFNPTGQSVALVDNGAGSNFFGWVWVSGANGGWMKFDCAGTGTCIKTDWRTIPNRPVVSSGSGGGGGAVIISPTPVPTPITPTTLVKTNIEKGLFPNIKIPFLNNRQPAFTEAVADNRDDTETSQPQDIPYGADPVVPTPEEVTPGEENQFTYQYAFSSDNNRINKPSCWFCIVKRFESVKSDKYIIKYNLIPESMEIPFPIPYTKTLAFIDLISLGATAFLVWSLWKIGGPLFIRFKTH